MSIHENGSSPLTRGKLAASGAGAGVSRLIPAHAGKTELQASACPTAAAHPRSRGENEAVTAHRVETEGSSPLTRGKLDAEGPPAVRGRLIPAHAGKTSRRLASRPRSGAHPRSRGENSRVWKLSMSGSGSSPLTRGKPSDRREHRRDDGLIPAHAGKTVGEGHLVCRDGAHPRSRGENLLYRSDYR